MRDRALANDEDVRQTSDELVLESVLDVDNIETTRVVLSVDNHTDTSQVSATGDHNKVAVLELEERLDLSGSNVDLDGVVDLDLGVGVTNCATIVCDKVGNGLLAELDAANLAEFVLSLLVGDAVDGETALGVVNKTEVLSSLGQRNNVHEASGESGISAHFTVNLDETLHENGSHLASVEGVLQTVTQENNKGKRLPELMGTRRRTRSVGTGELVKHPVLRRSDALQMLLGSTSHRSMKTFW